MIVFTCNVRGLVSPLKLGEIKKFMRQHHVFFVGFLETRVKAHNKDRIMKKFGNSWRWEHNYEASSRGRIWIAWNPSTVSVQVLIKTAKMVHCRVGDKQVGDQWFLTVVYGGRVFGWILATLIGVFRNPGALWGL